MESFKVKKQPVRFALENLSDSMQMEWEAAGITIAEDCQRVRGGS